MGGPELEHEDSSAAAVVVSRPRPRHFQRLQGNKAAVAPPPPSSPFMAVESPLFDTVVVLDRLPEDGAGADDGDNDQLFLLPESVLGMDSISFREDVASIAPSFIPNFSSGYGGVNNSPHNSLDSTDSNRSLRPIEEHPSAAAAGGVAVVGTPDGLRMARASNGCKTLWLCKMKRTLLQDFFFARCFKSLPDDRSIFMNGEKLKA